MPVTDFKDKIVTAQGQVKTRKVKRIYQAISAEVSDRHGLSTADQIAIGKYARSIIEYGMLTDELDALDAVRPAVPAEPEDLPLYKYYLSARTALIRQRDLIDKNLVVLSKTLGIGVVNRRVNPTTKEKEKTHNAITGFSNK